MTTTFTHLDIEQGEHGTVYGSPSHEPVVNRDQLGSFEHLQSDPSQNGSSTNRFFDDSRLANIAEQPAIAYPSPRAATIQYHFQTLQQWEGTILEVTDDEIVSHLRSLGPSIPDKRATISRDEISDSDQQLVLVGAVFYWTIGYRIELHGQKSLMSVIRLRRLPTWTRREVEHVDRVASQFDSFFE
jgi:hypothetical protein